MRSQAGVASFFCSLSLQLFHGSTTVPPPSPPLPLSSLPSPPLPARKPSYLAGGGASDRGGGAGGHDESHFVKVEEEVERDKRPAEEKK